MNQIILRNWFKIFINTLLHIRIQESHSPLFRIIIKLIITVRIEKTIGFSIHRKYTIVAKAIKVAIATFIAGKHRDYWLDV